MEDLHRIAESIWKWAKDRDFKGYDPYDGLNSRLLAPLLKHSRFLRLATIQAVKRCPFNPRKLLLISPGLNPKGLALFLSGISYMPELDTENTAERLQQMILSLASKPDGTPAFSTVRTIRNDISVEELEESELFAWGYNFPWQSKAFFQPAWFPTVVCSSFVLDAFKQCRSSFYPAVAINLAKFTAETLNIHKDDSGICFSYSPNDNSRVFNASLFAAKILTRAIEFDENNADLYSSLATRACDYVVSRQSRDGSWVYGEADHWQWVDNLHTGFVLETLNSIVSMLSTDKYDDSIARGLNYYTDNLFEKDWTAKYFSSSKYPLDPHSTAQGAITYMELNRFNDNAPQITKNILHIGIADLWDIKRQGFIFQKYPSHMKRMIYLRWSQGWMFKALSFFYHRDNTGGQV
ncbi:MAG: hypothetical protein KAR44_05790 [Candidatus Aegiribacteria sp.]|nr:hypothetical protein [Candidatus Aegiribacteria sp.]